MKQNTQRLWYHFFIGAMIVTLSGMATARDRGFNQPGPVGGTAGVGAPGVGVLPGVGVGAPGVGVLPDADVGAPGVGVLPGVGVGAPGVGVLPGVGVGAPGAGVLPGNGGGPVNRVGRHR